MTGSTLRLALPLAGLLIVAPVEARELGHETVGDFVNLPPGAQIKVPA